jgi:hypothetical protein
MRYFPNSILVQSSHNAKVIYDKVSIDYETNRFLIFKLDKNYYGRLPNDAWEWIKGKL